jgi:hypothetical protein
MDQNLIAEYGNEPISLILRLDSRMLGINDEMASPYNRDYRAVGAHGPLREICAEQFLAASP